MILPRIAKSYPPGCEGDFAIFLKLAWSKKRQLKKPKTVNSINVYTDRIIQEWEVEELDSKILW